MNNKSPLPVGAVPLHATGLCGRFAEELSTGYFTVQVHSVFKNALNISAGGRMYSILPESRCLFPYSCTVGYADCFKALRPAMKVHLSRTSILIPEAAFSVDLSEAPIKELSVWKERTAPKEGLSGEVKVLTELLKASDAEPGMRPLVTLEPDSIYSSYIRNRLVKLHSAFAALDIKDAETAAAGIAGCGIGLTPSSDDLLCGYICAFTALCAMRGFPKREEALRFTEAAANAAAVKTNEISASFLKQSGEGLASQDVLELMDQLFSDSSPDVLERAGRRVLDFGSTSGADILTGIILAINFHYGR